MHRTWQAQKINTCTTIFPKFDLTLAELHLKVALDPVVGVGVHLTFLNLFQSTQHGQKHVGIFLVLMYIWQF